MASLSDLRNEIDEIDKRLHDLLMRRVEIGREVAEAKTGTDAGPNLRPGREAQIIRGLAARNNGPLSKFGPMWGDIDCGAQSFNWPKSHSRVVMVPICEGKSMTTA